MESYGRFAGVYDVFMDNVNYREWADYIIVTLAQDEIRRIGRREDVFVSSCSVILTFSVRHRISQRSS